MKAVSRDSLLGWWMNHADCCNSSYNCFSCTVIKNRNFQTGFMCEIFIIILNCQLLEIRYWVQSALEFLSAFLLINVNLDILVVSSYLLELHSSGVVLHAPALNTQNKCSALLRGLQCEGTCLCWVSAGLHPFFSLLLWGSNFLSRKNRGEKGRWLWGSRSREYLFWSLDLSYILITLSEFR